MIQLPEDRRPPITPQLAFRVAILGGVALVLFAIVFFRLWYLQVLSGDQYLARANTNRVRSIVTPAPRGQIVDRNGTVLVDNRNAVALEIAPPLLPKKAAPRRAVLTRVSRLVGEPLKPEKCQVGRALKHLAPLECAVERGQYQLPYANVIVKPDVPPAVYNYYYERQNQFPGVTVQTVYTRHYPYGQIGAQLFGTVGQITKPELHDEHFRGVRGGTVVGQAGLEYAYDRYLRGTQGAQRVQVNSLGQPTRYLGARKPRQGETLALSLDLGLERAGQQALQQGISAAQANGNPAAAGAFVALDPRNGEVLGMGSYPSFDPNVFAKPITQKHYNQLFGKSANYPQLNRALQSGYPTGSTFKPFTATAALESGTITPETVIDDPGCITIGLIPFCDAGHSGAGAVSLRSALQVSSDVFFYRLGQYMNSPRPSGGPLQRWAHRYGIGRKTGIDLPGEIAGNLPSPRWRAERNAEELRCEKHNKGKPCYISDLRSWTVGDNVNTAVGQGDVLATPLQMATAYSALANGGRVVTPHIGLQVEDAIGHVLQRLDPQPARRLHIRSDYRQAILDGLRMAAMSPGGTSYDVWVGFGRTVYGKTGTAQHTGQADQSWYVCYLPDPERPIVIAVTIEQGGFGAEAAAPAARLIASQWFGKKGQFVAGSSHTL